MIGNTGRASTRCALAGAVLFATVAVAGCRTPTPIEIPEIECISDGAFSRIASLLEQLDSRLADRDLAELEREYGDCNTLNGREPGDIEL